MADRLERLLRRDRLLVGGALVLVTVMAWAWMLAGAGMGMSGFEMTRHTRMGMDMMPAAQWGTSYAALMFFMWWIMMIAMMLPSAAPMILLHAKIAKSSASAENLSRLPWSTATFAMGYMLSWAGFSVIAVTLQRQFELLGVLSPMMLNSTNAIFAGIVLIVAGLYQMTPLKQSCLEHCHSPIAFLSQHWREGPGGGVVMGLKHGSYCLGCCWGLMAILFFGGIMNLYWIVGLAMIVLIEKLFPVGVTFGRIIGVLLFVWGASFVYSAL